MSNPALALSHVSFVRDGRTILDDVSLRVERDQHWLVLGPNGSGKTSLVRIAAMHDHPTRGTVAIGNDELGRADVRAVRRRVGYVSASLAAELRPQLVVADVVMTAKNAALEAWWHRYDEADRSRALACLERMGVEALAERAFGTLSSGEQQRVLIARSLMNEPDIVILDEPSARLDLGGRERLVSTLTEFIADPSSPPLVLVTHHLDEVPIGMTHALLLASGRVRASGPIDSVITSASLSDCFGLDLELVRRPDGRRSAWARR